MKYSLTRRSHEEKSEGPPLPVVSKISLSVCFVLGVRRYRHLALLPRANFSLSASGTDYISTVDLDCFKTHNTSKTTTQVNGPFYNLNSANIRHRDTSKVNANTLARTICMDLEALRNVLHVFGPQHPRPNEHASITLYVWIFRTETGLLQDISDGNANIPALCLCGEVHNKSPDSTFFS